MGFIIDELTALTHQEIMGESIFANDIDELVNMTLPKKGKVLQKATLFDII
jgi:hypothetical protein